MYQKNLRGWFKYIDFILLDIICVQFAFYISYVLRQHDFNPYIVPLYRNVSIVVIFVDLIIIFIFDYFNDVLNRGYYREFASCVKQSIMLLLVCSLYLITVQDGNEYSRVSLFTMGGLYLILTYIIRIVWKRTLRNHIRIGKETSLVIITNSKIACNVINNVKEKNYEMYIINGVIVVDKDMTGELIENIPVVSNLENAAETLLQMWVDEVFINLDDSIPYPKQLIDRCTEMALTVHRKLENTSENESGNQFVERLGDYIVLTSSLNSMTYKQALLKRSIDILAGFIGCLFTIIIVIFIGPIIYINSPGPIFFSQERVGQNGKTFKMYKFRSMYMDAEERKADLMKQNTMSNSLMFKMDFDPRIIGNKVLPDGTRKTGIGQFIRSTSLDEFPQFLNILKGDMSLVGYRPALLSEYEQYKFHHRARISMKPGLTGMWQVSGRSDITDFEEVVELDTEYIKNWSMGLDFRILFKTFFTVLSRDGSR